MNSPPDHDRICPCIRVLPCVALPGIGETSPRHHIRFREALSRPRARIHALLPIAVKLFRLSVPAKTYLHVQTRTPRRERTRLNGNFRSGDVQASRTQT